MSQSHGVSEPSDDKLRQYGLAAQPSFPPNHAIMDMFKCVLNFEAKKRDPLVIFGVTILGNHTKSHLIGVSSAYDSSALPGLVEFKGGILREETRSGLAGPM